MILWTTDAYRVTGQSRRSPVRCWVRESLLMPFFWSWKVTVMNSARGREGLV